MGLLFGHFLTHLFCGLFSCSIPYEYPSDPLNISVRTGRTFDIIDQNPIVQTDNGAVEGYVTFTILGRPVYTFEGIPYGESTGGRNRFRNPVPKRRWQGVRQAKATGSPCIQLHTFKFSVLGNEDCLFVNIYTPELPLCNRTCNSLLPVVVWFHGGGFHFGSGDEYGPAYLLDHDMILVTMNYRVGIYGFLSTMDKSSPGNYGLKDQALALKWINQNIQYFGGNPSLVTLMGQSAGGTAVHLHMISEKSRPYFNGGIAFSGNALSSWAIIKERHVATINARIANNTSCPTLSTLLFVKCLRLFDPYDLARREAFLSDWLQWPAIILGPVVERRSRDAFLTEYPEDAYFLGKVANYPLVVSSTAQEGEQASIFLDGTLMFRSLSTKWKERAPVFLDYKYIIPTEKHEEITDKISEFYFRGKNPQNVNSRVYGLMTSDALFHYPVHKVLKTHSKIASTYGTIFGYKGQYGFGNLFGFGQSKYGVVHTDDIWLYFNSSTYLPGYRTSDVDYQIVKVMTSWIYNFAATRNPLITDENGTDHEIWNPVKNQDNIQVLSISNEIKMIPEPKQKNLRFWASLGIFN